MTSCKYIFLCFFLLTSFFQIHLDAYDKSLEPLDELAQDMKDIQLSAVFCPEDWSKKECAHPKNRDDLLKDLIDNNPSDFIRRAKEAAVRVEMSFYGEQDPSSCSATVVKLKRNGQTCPKNILLSTGHCFFDRKGPLRNVSFFRSPDKKVNLDVDKIQSLKTDCATSELTKKKDDCFVGDEESQISRAYGTDQALIPISYNLPEYVRPLEIEIDNVLTSGEMDSCIKGSEKKKINMVSLFHKSHFKFFDTKYTNQISKRIFALKCSSKKEDVGLETSYSVIPDSKKSLGNLCPTLPGSSGSLINFSCGRRGKKGIFVHSTASPEIKAPLHYEKSHKTNGATHITKKLLNRAFERFCKTGIAQAH